MAKKFTGGSFISDRSGFRHRASDATLEPGTGYLVSKNESDREYNLVDHPVNHPTRYAKFDDPKPVKYARPERTFPDAQNAWTGRGYCYFNLNVNLHTTHTKFASGTSSMVITTQCLTLTAPNQEGSGTSSMALTATAEGFAGFISSGTSSMTLTATCTATSQSSASGQSYSTAFSSAFAVYGSPVSYNASGSSSLTLTALCNQSVKGGTQASGTSTMALTASCTGTYKTSGVTGSFSTAFSYAFNR